MDKVGKSDRTPGKHCALNGYIGKHAGVIVSQFRDRKVWFIDCTAGDGQAGSFELQTSPGIMLRHAKWLRARGVAVDVLLFERSEKNSRLLACKVRDRATVTTGSSRDMEQVWGMNDLLFVSNDPNTVKDWALPDVLAKAPQMTTVFSTLGCNVGGLKRLPIDQRNQWYVQMRQQAKLLQWWHDMMLVTLVGDSSQWAYAVNSPIKWRQQLLDIFKKSFGAVGYETECTWLKQDPKKFSDSVDRLFLTRKEYENVSANG